ncbi:ABC transporter ATP-binding protein [Streptococcus devriesei]|uniref:ABC transporter ATP-binding protein n=1 Tax=Streptococcus devriesei TaxID=231233 RepID=UPI000416B602|nr:ABC transporter ATP-binding protein [Streptococcus devriesei]
MVIEIEDICKRIGKTDIIKSVTFSVEKGSTFALLGPNGAGKTTIIRLLLGVLGLDSGKVKLFDEVLTTDNRARLLKRIGVQNDGNLYEKLTVRENLHFFGKLYTLSENDIAKRIDDLKEVFHIQKYLDMELGTLSKGNRQKVLLARAMLHSPELLILDEPTTGLDPEAIDEFNSLIKKIKQQGVTVIMCTHYLYGLDDLVDSIGILDNGKLLVSGSLESLRNPQSQLRISGKLILSEELMKDVHNEHDKATQISLSITDRDKIPEIVTSLVHNESQIYSVQEQKESIKDIYFRIIGGNHEL